MAPIAAELAEASLAGMLRASKRQRLPSLKPAYTLSSRRPYTNTHKTSAPSLGGAPQASLFGGAFGNSGNTPTTFFSKPSLPANTIVRFVPQQTAWIVERMGKFNRILQPGLAILIPFLDRIAYVKSLKETAIEIPSQSAITADNVTLELDGVLYTRVFDAYKASYATAM